MKLEEICQDLDEGRIKNAIASAALATAAIGLHGDTVKVNKAEPVAQQTIKKSEVKQDNLAQVAERISARYKIDIEDAESYVALAKKHENEVFPKAEDLIALMGVESSFNPEAKSGLRKDPALGLTQIRPGVWKINPAELSSEDNQVKYAAKILKDYYKQLGGNMASAFEAYNVGITAFKTKSRLNPAYFAKISAEKNHLKL
jgi:soluble lytic murein transglycosylase-like protein